MDEIKSLPVMLTPMELAEFLNVSKNTMYAFLKDGRIPYVKVGRQIRIYREDVSNFINPEKP